MAARCPSPALGDSRPTRHRTTAPAGRHHRHPVTTGESTDDHHHSPRLALVASPSPRSRRHRPRANARRKGFDSATLSPSQHAHRSVYDVLHHRHPQQPTPLQPHALKRQRRCHPIARRRRRRQKPQPAPPALKMSPRRARHVSRATHVNNTSGAAAQPGGSSSSGSVTRGIDP